MLTDLARQEIELLELDGIKLTYDEIVEIAHLAQLINSPDVRRSLSRGTPIPCGHTYLYPPTFQSYDWMQDTLQNAATVSQANAVTAYAMAHCYDPQEPFLDRSYAAVKKAEKWIKTLRVTPNEIIECMSQVIEQVEDHDEPDTEPDSKKNVSIGEVSTKLAALTGRTCIEIEQQISMSYAFRLLFATLSNQAAAAGQKTPDPAALKALRRLGQAIKRIRENHG